jgi:VWFA-related protein
MSRAERPCHCLLAILVVLSVSVLNRAQSPSSQTNQHQTSPLTAQTSVANPSSNSAAQANKAQEQPVYESASVLKAVTRLVVVDVVATDKKGEPVKGLTQSDFSILEDGKEQAIKVFSFQQPKGQDASGAPTLVKENLPVNIYSNIPSYKPDGGLNVVLLDALNTTIPNQAYVRDQMLRYLDRMPQDRPVAVYVLGTKLRLLQDFTTDRSVLKEVVRKVKSSASPLLDTPAGEPPEELLPPGVADSGMLSASMLDSMMSFERERTAVQTDLRIAYTLNAMTLVAHQLAGYPGRKNLVWVSEAFPINIDPDMELRNAFSGSRNYGPEIEAAATAMMDAQIAVYPVDARGLVGSSYFSAASSGRDRFGRSLSSGSRLNAELSRESGELQGTHSSMQDLAERTGGRAFYNRNDIDDAIRRSFDDGSTYYTLAYYPANKKWDGKFRKIHVKVDRLGIKLRYRFGYYATDPKIVATRNEKEQTAIFSDAMSLDTPLATALSFHAGVVPPSPATQNKVVVNFGIDPHAMSFAEDNSGLQHGSAECAVTAFTEKGKYVKSVAGTATAALKPETFGRLMQGYFPCRQVVELQPGNYLLRLGVRDLNTGLLGTTDARVTVPVAQAELQGKN